MYGQRLAEYPVGEAERALKKTRFYYESGNSATQDCLRQQHPIDVKGPVNYAEAHHGFWDQAKAQKASMTTGRNVIALSAVAGGSLMPFQVTFPAQPCGSTALPPTTIMTPAIPAPHQHAYYHCPPPDPLRHCPAPDALHLQSQAYETPFEPAFLQPDGQQGFGNLVHLHPGQEVMGAFLPESRSASPIIHPRLAVHQAMNKGEGANDMMLRLLITQAQANFLVRKDGGVVRLQSIRNQMKAIGAACEIKLYDDKGQKSDDHCLEIRGSCENAPQESPALACLMIILELLLHQAKATCIRMAIPEGDQPGKLLGTKGACIAGIRKQTGAGVKLAQDLAEILEADGCIEGVASGDRLLTISGPAPAILSAASECALKLLESQHGEPGKQSQQLQPRSNPSSPSLPLQPNARRGRSLSPSVSTSRHNTASMQRSNAHKRLRDTDSNKSSIELWITRQQKEVLMGPKGGATKVIQQIRNDHTTVFLKLHDDGCTADQKRRLELRGPSKHHVEAVKYDIDQAFRKAGQPALPELAWDSK